MDILRKLGITEENMGYIQHGLDLDGLRLLYLGTCIYHAQHGELGKAINQAAEVARVLLTIRYDAKE